MPNPDIVHTQEQFEILSIAQEAIHHSLATAENALQKTPQPIGFTPLVLSVLVRVTFERLVSELEQAPDVARSTLIALLIDLVLEAEDEVKSKQHG